MSQQVVHSPPKGRRARETDLYRLSYKTTQSKVGYGTGKCVRAVFRVLLYKRLYIVIMIIEHNVGSCKTAEVSMRMLSMYDCLVTTILHCIHDDCLIGYAYA